MTFWGTLPQKTQRKNVFLNPDFITTSWHGSCRTQSTWGQGLKSEGPTSWDGLHIPGGWLNTMALESLAPSHAHRLRRRARSGSAPCLTAGGRAGGLGGEKLTLSDCHARAWRNRKVSSNLKGKKKPLGWTGRHWGAGLCPRVTSKEHVSGRGMGQKKAY